jgi:hypothetical protein
MTTEDIGRAEAWRVLDPLGDLGVEPAPRGYEWVALPGSGSIWGVQGRALCCIHCGALVGDHVTHTVRHAGSREDTRHQES